MAVRDVFKHAINITPREEFNHAFGRVEEANYSKGLSIKGRAVCLIVIPLHLVGIVAKPALYLIAAAGYLVLGNACTVAYVYNSIINNRTRQEYAQNRRLFALVIDSFKRARNLTGCAFVAPLGQIAQAAKAGAGFFHPGAYFKEPVITETIIPESTIRLRPIHGGRLDITCDFDQPTEKPVETLRLIAEEIKKTPMSGIRVQYNNSDGIDAGGLKRDFMYRLFDKLSDGLNSKNRIPLWNESIEPQLKDIGVLFKFLIPHHIDLGNETPIGLAFTPETFQWLLALTHDEIEADFDAIPDGRFLEIMIDMTTEAGAQKDFYTGLQDLLEWDGQDQTSAEGLAHIRYIENNYETCMGDELPEGSIDENGLIEQSTLDRIKKEMLTETISVRKQQLHTLHSIAKGMDCDSERWDDLQALGHQEMQEIIQGKFSKEALKEALGISRNFNPETRAAILAWVDTKTDQELKCFVATITGTSTISGTISIRPIEYGRAAAHTCSKSLDLLIDPTKDQALNLRGILTTLDEYCAPEGAEFDIS